MIFGAASPAEAVGAIIAHAVPGPEGMLRKGHVVTAEDAAHFRAAGLESVVVARLEPDDIPEDEAAHRIARALAGTGIAVEAPATGRSNLFADGAGLLVVDRAGIDRLNSIDPGITFATLKAFAPVEAGRMAATVKIIPFALPRAVVDRAVEVIGASGPLIRVQPFTRRRVAAISTLLPSLKSSVVDKTVRVLVDRLKLAGGSVAAERRVGHDEASLAAALADLAPEAELVVVFGASAVVDEDDVIPAAIRRAGGTVDRFGMPVDPGNLLLLGHVGTVPVVGAPGCARSPRENGFDWVLQRLLAGLEVGDADIVGFGVGGLLMDIVTRPAPRLGTVEAETPAERRIGGIVLAAGRSSRMEGGNKLLARLDDKPLVVHAAEAALGAGLAPVVAVTGHQAAEVEAALAGLPLQTVRNPDFAAGMSTSLRAGLAALPDDAEAAVILLGDMPRVSAGLVTRLVEAYDPARGQLIVVPTVDGRRGNPVLIARRFFDDLARVTGDIGARDVIRAYPEAVTEIEADGAATLDLDTREALEAAGGRLT